MSKAKPEAVAEAKRRIEIASRKRDTDLNLSGLGLNDEAFAKLLPSISRLKDLKVLSLQSNLLEKLPLSIGSLATIERLELHDNRLESLSSSFGGLLSLVSLYLDGNRLEKLPDSFGNLSRLRELWLNGNDIQELPESFENLTSLEELWLNRNKLGKLPSGFGKLQRLKQLWLNGNHLNELPESLGQMASLEALYLHDNQIASVPNCLGELKSLRCLWLSANPLASVPAPLSRLPALQELSLINTSLEVLPLFLRDLPKLRKLFLHDNPGLNVPPEFLGPNPLEDHEKAKREAADPGDVLAYYFAASSEGNAEPLHEVKLLLLGRGGAGKSSIRERLVHDRFEAGKKSTLGIEIEPWRIQVPPPPSVEADGDAEITVHLWDFAGQEITHATHQFFLSVRSVYVIVLDGRSDSAMRDAETWLRIAVSYGRQSPIIVVLNKFESEPFQVDEFNLKKRYPSIREFLRTDCDTNLGFAELRQQIQEAIQGLEDVFRPFPMSWHRVKDRLLEMRARSEPYISMASYFEICEEFGLAKDEYMPLANALDCLGVILYYGDDERLREDSVLSPHWLTNGVYTLLRHKNIEDSTGELSFAEAKRCLPDVDERMVRFLVELMRKYELCFPVEGRDDLWLIPNILPPYPKLLGEEWFSEQSTIRLRYRYSVVPSGLIARFITRTYQLSTGQPRWRNGTVLQLGDEKALVQMDPETAEVDIRVIGPDEKRRNWLASLVRFHLDEISPDFGQENPLVDMEMSGYPGSFVSIKRLENDEQGETPTTVEVDERSVVVDPTSELNRIRVANERAVSGDPLRLFISYCQEDSEKFYDVFQQNLGVMVRWGLIRVWSDRKLLPGGNWDRVIHSRLEEADIIVFLMSTSFLNSEYCQDIEVQQAIEQAHSGRSAIASILLDNCSFKHSPLAEFQMISPGGKSVQAFAAEKLEYDFAYAFNVVQEELEALIEQHWLTEGGKISDLGWSS